MEKISSLLNGIILPFLIILCGIILARKIKLLSILRPTKFAKVITEASCDKKQSPFKSMCTALAATLGVGNIAGVSTAITSGGAGAVFWMWIGAVMSMSVKYGEVALAVKYRNFSDKRGFYGGAMYTLNKSLNKHIGKKCSYMIGAIFSLLCIANSFVMGNVIQSNAAGAVFHEKSQLVGIALSLGLLITAIAGFKKISDITMYLIPPLSVVYIILSLAVITRYYYLLPNIILKIIKSAFSGKAVTGGLYGIGIKEAIRFGITRGIFSNEAGCGTAPSAHASANVKSPHHQGCFGIFEVITDTLILCSMTAFVVLISDSLHGTDLSCDGIKLTLRAFADLLGTAAYYIIGISVILFAFATIIAQLHYGEIAIGYFTDCKPAKVLFIITSVILCYLGATMNQSSIWIWADLIIAIITVINTTVLIIFRNQIKEIAANNN